MGIPAVCGLRIKVYQGRSVNLEDQQVFPQYHKPKITSSHKSPQSNSEDSPIVKDLLKKAADHCLARLAYRATPLQNG